MRNIYTPTFIFASEGHDMCMYLDGLSTSPLDRSDEQPTVYAIGLHDCLELIKVPPCSPSTSRG